MLTDVNENADGSADDIVNAVGNACIGDKRNARLNADNTPATIISQKKFMGIHARLSFHVSSPAGTGIINFGVVYCRVSARESRFGNLRGKIWQYFECYCNYLRIRVIARCVAILRAKEEC